MSCDSLARFLRAQSGWLLFGALLAMVGCSSNGPSTGSTTQGTPNDLDTATLVSDSAAPRPAMLQASLPSAQTNQPATSHEANIEYIAFTAVWCSVCRDVPKAFEELESKFPNVRFRQIDIDDEEHTKLMVSLGVSAVPFNCLMVNGQTVATFKGFLPPADAEKWLRQALQQP